MLHPSCAMSPQPSQKPNPHLITGHSSPSAHAQSLARGRAGTPLRDCGSLVLAGSGCGTLVSKPARCSLLRDSGLRGLALLWTSLIWALWSAWLHAVDTWRRRRIQCCLPGPDPNCSKGSFDPQYCSIPRHLLLWKRRSQFLKHTSLSLPHHDLIHLQPPSHCHGLPGQSPWAIAHLCPKSPPLPW